MKERASRRNQDRLVRRRAGGEAVSRSVEGDRSSERPVGSLFCWSLRTYLRPTDLERAFNRRVVVSAVFEVKKPGGWPRRILILCGPILEIRFFLCLDLFPLSPVPATMLIPAGEILNRR